MNSLFGARRIKDVHIQAGGVYFGDSDSCIMTVLGSCVAVVVWHPLLKVGGMCHFMLPQRPCEARGSELDAHYGDEAFELLRRGIDKFGVPLREYQTKLFGGGNVVPTLNGREGKGIGLLNSEAAHALVKRHGLVCATHDLGGTVGRSVKFIVESGRVLVRQHEMLRVDGVERGGSVRRARGAAHGLG